jgi:hypothetical protein
MPPVSDGEQREFRVKWTAGESAAKQNNDPKHKLKREMEYAVYD